MLTNISCSPCRSAEELLAPACHRLPCLKGYVSARAPSSPGLEVANSGIAVETYIATFIIGAACQVLQGSVSRGPPSPYHGRAANEALPKIEGQVASLLAPGAHLGVSELRLSRRKGLQAEIDAQDHLELNRGSYVGTEVVLSCTPKVQRHDNTTERDPEMRKLH